MNFCDFYAGQDDENRRLDRVIRIFAKELTLPQIYSGIRKNLIKVNDKKTDAAYHLKKNDKISIAEFLIEKTETQNITSPLEKKTNNSQNKANLDIKNIIVFENEHILILNKPYNICVHDGKNNLTQMVNDYLKKDIRDSLSFTPGPLHRLDKQTTGLIAFSKTIDGARWFTKEIQNHSIKKKYIGISEGKLKETQSWEDEIPQNAKTIAMPLSYGKFINSKDKNSVLDLTLIRFSIFTGRKHQIRIQSQLHKIPLLGDERYGAKKISSLKRNFYLHAEKLEIPDNPLNLPPEISCKPAPDFISFLEECNFSLKTLNLEL